jgi:hypothetical protein
MSSINIPLGADLSGLKSGLDQGAKIVSDASEKFASAADKASKRASGGIDSIQNSGKTLQQQFRLLQREAIELAAKYGATSEQAVAAARAAGEVKDQIQDTKVVIDAFAADSKFTDVAGAMKQAAGAATIVTGAMGLLGVKSEETQAMLLKVQSALALTQGLAQIKEMGAAFTALSAVIKMSVIPSLITMNGLIVASGIGAFVAIVGVLAYNWFKTSEAQKEAAETLRQLKKVTEEYHARAQDLNVQLLKGTQRTYADINNETTKAILERVKRIREIEENASKESRNLNQAELLEIQRLKEEQVKINQIGEQKILDAKKAAAEEARKAREAEAQVIRDNIKAEQEATLRSMRVQEKYDESRRKMNADTNKQIHGNTKEALDAIAAEFEDPKFSEVRAKIVFDKIQPKIDAIKIMNEIADITQQFTQRIGAIFTQMASDMAFSIGESLGGKDIDWGKNMKIQLAKLMQLVGAAVIAMGTATSAVGNPMGPYQIAAGLALQVAAGVLSATAGAGGGGGSVGSPSANVSQFNTGFGAGNSRGGMASFNSNTRIEGNDLIIVYERSSNFNKRG